MIASMVFAAGLGTRMRPLTNDRPKAMVHVHGRPLIDHALDQVQGCAPVVVNVHHHAEVLIDHLAQRPDLTVVHERGALLETGGGLKHALPRLGTGPVLTMNADSAWTGPLAADTLRAAWDPDRMDGLLLLVPHDRSVGHVGGSFAMAPDGRLSWEKGGLIYCGAGIVKTDGLADIDAQAFSLRDLWQPMFDAGRIYGVLHPGRWADVGTPEGIKQAEDMLDAEQ